MNEQTIFLTAIDIADVTERTAYVQQVCAGDATLRRQVEDLLAAHERPGDFLEVPALEQMDSRLRSNPAETCAELCETGDITLSFLQPSTQTDSLGRLGHYEIREVIGRGGCGIVLKAFDELLHRLVAIKVMSPELAATSPARKRFLREARAAAAVRHENVVGIHAVEETPIPFLVMEYIDGQTLQQRLDQQGPFDLPDMLQIGIQIAKGLAAAHAIGLVHRDIKPSNILIESGNRLKITDFGLARTSDDASITQSGVIAGTPLYMSPEQAYGDTIDPRTDLFSLGSVLYVMCSGRPPFRAATTLAVLKRVAEDQPRPIREIIPEAPQWLIAIIEKLLAKKPAGRFASAQEVADLLASHLRALESPAAAANPPSVTPASVTPASVPLVNPFADPPRPQPAKLERPARTSSYPWAAAAVMLVALLGGLSLTEAAGLTDVRGTVIRLLTPDGVLVVEVDDPGVSVTLDGQDVVITGAGVKEIRLKPGNYQVTASKDGKVVRQELVTVAQNGRQILRISKEVAPPVDLARKRAEYVLAVKGRVTIVQDGDERQIQAVGELLPSEAFELTGVDLAGNTRVTDEGLSVFKGCTSVTKLFLKDTPVGDAGLGHFKKCRDLEFLFLQRTRVTDAGLAPFKDLPNLTRLHLDGTEVGDAGLAHFKNCKSLIVVGLDGTKVTDAALDYSREWRNLTNLGLNNTAVSDGGLAELRNCTSLTHLHLNDTQAGNSGLGLEQLRGMNALVHIDLKNTKITAEGVQELSAAHPRCKIVWDGGTIEPR